MPKVNYDKQPFRVCRWNKKFRTDNNSTIPSFRGDTNRSCEYYCEDGGEYVDEDYCMKCFCNDWFHVCSTCNKEVIKTELTHVFLPEYKMGYICNDCYDGEELVQRNLSDKERSIIYEINKWKKLNKKDEND